MIFALGLLAGFGVAWALGADLSRLATVRMRGTPLVIVALAIQIVVFTSLNTIIATNMDTSLHVLSYALIIGFFLLNVRLPGFWLVGFGVFANALVITLNHGRMPVSRLPGKAQEVTHVRSRSPARTPTMSSPAHTATSHG